MVNLVFHSNDVMYPHVLEYIYDNYNDKINDFVYKNDSNLPRYCYRSRMLKDAPSIKSIVPYECDFEFIQKLNDEDIKFHCRLENVLDCNGLIRKYSHSLGHCDHEDRIMKKLTLTTDIRDNIIELIDSAKQFIKEKHETQKKSNNETIKIFYYQKEFWSLLSKSPKRSIDTLYLKEGEKDKLLSVVEEFYHPDTRDIYLSFGMPYKHIIMLYGVPGSGKTSTIGAIASYFDCDIYTIPITKELSDYGLIDAFSFVNDKDDRKRIIVLEDIDCLFDNTRKEGDEHNMITLQSLLNCLDGYMCVEGTLLFMTANNPEKMDYAMVRSCRVDFKLELGYADEYQTRSIFTTFLPNQSENFDKFYRKIRHMEVTTAMLQEFLFYNRKCENILEHLDKFTEIVEKNKPSELSTDKNEKNLYM
uniref:AAA+ ATPase domain-containing protein n=1 Tax=viral metagenome TaxID=1070528 RepID=A0A6C0CDV6_9ZZZZ